MVVAGSVEIVGHINVEQIKHGLNSLKQGLDNAKASAKGAFGDMERMGATIGKIGKNLAAIGVGLASALIGIAAMSPTIAPILARMGADFERMSRVIGNELKPVFEEFEGMFEDFVGWLGSEEGRGVLEDVKTIFMGLAEVVKSVGKNAGLAWTALKDFGGTISTVIDISFGSGAAGKLIEWLIERGAFPAAAALIGLKVGGPIGAVVAGAGAAVAQELGRYESGQDSLLANNMVTGLPLATYEGTKEIASGGNQQNAWLDMINIFLTAVSGGLIDFTKGEHLPSAIDTNSNVSLYSKTMKNSGISN